MLLQSALGITKCDKLLLQSASYITKCDRLYYKVRQVLKSATVITKWDATQVLSIFVTGISDGRCCFVTLFCSSRGFSIRITEKLPGKPGRN